jgi:hypothetical protein
MSGMTPDDDGLRKRFLNHPSDLTYPTPIQVGNEVTGSGPLRESMAFRFSGFQIFMKADTYISRSGVSYVVIADLHMTMLNRQINVNADISEELR